MAQRNWFGQATGRAGERILSGSNNYDPRTGRWRNVEAGLIGTGARMLISAVGGPVIGALAGRGINKLVDRYGKDPQFVQPESIPIPIHWGAPEGMGRVATAPQSFTPPTVANLGLGAQTPGNSWQGYLQGQGAVNNFGNTQFGNGMAGIPSNWAPQSTWGQSVAEGQGSNINFGNYSPGATATGAVRGGGGGASGVNSGSRGGGGGNSVGDAGGARSAFWRKTYQQN